MKQEQDTTGQAHDTAHNATPTREESKAPSPPSDNVLLEGIKEVEPGAGTASAACRPVSVTVPAPHRTVISPLLADLSNRLVLSGCGCDLTGIAKAQACSFFSFLLFNNNTQTFARNMCPQVEALQNDPAPPSGRAPPASPFQIELLGAWANFAKSKFKLS